MSFDSAASAQLSGQLSDPWSALLERARAVRQHAYAPYSGFGVGAALLTPTGEIFVGANIENASYGLSRCGEQSAIQALASSGARHFSHLLVYTEADPPATPCGACRQILFEFGPDALVLCTNHLGAERRYRVRDLLPDGFGASDFVVAKS
jgi:cytidine deaminase